MLVVVQITADRREEEEALLRLGEVVAVAEGRKYGMGLQVGQYRELYWSVVRRGCLQLDG